MSTSKRIFLNSSILYIKTAITVFVSIFYSRYLLAALGVEDYGIYNLVGGIIGMLGFITATLSNSGTRFIARSLGEENEQNTKEIFISVLYVTKKIVWILVIGLEVVGLIFINFILNIPGERMLAANIVYQFMIINSAYNMMTAPYSGLLFSREKIAFIAILEIIDVFIKLLIAVFLTYSNTDRLILYGLLLMLLSFIHRTILKEYCKKNDPVVPKTNKDFHLVNKELNTSLLSFSGWNLIGSLGIIAQRQGTIFLVNVFFGVVVNAALGVAMVVNNQLSNLSSSLLSAIQPQIFKSFGEGNLAKQEFYTVISSKMGIILLSFALIPLLVEVNYILDIWLIEVPEYTSIFIRLYLVLTIMGHMSYGLTIAMQGHGKIKELQISTFTLQVLNIPIAYIFYKLDFPVYSILIISIFVEIIIFFVRLFLANKYLSINISKYISNVIFGPSIMIILAISISFTILHFFQPSIMRLVLITLLNGIFIFIFSYSLILNIEEKLVIKKIKYTLLGKMKNKKTDR